MNTDFGYHFPAIRGIQAGREYYVSMCPLKLIPKIFIFDEEELVPEIRAQRTLNKVRVPEISDYILENPDSYVFSAITASIDGEIRFDPLEEKESSGKIGSLHIDMRAQFIINDGQHRRAAIEQALKNDPKLGDETIAVVFFIDRGLALCQQMFADLNRYAIRPSRSLGLLYDHRDDRAQIAKLVALRSKTFENLVEMEKSTLSGRSRKLFTLSAIHSGNSALLNGQELSNIDSAVDKCLSYWDAVGEVIPEWRQVRESKITAGEVRRDFIHSHALVLQSLGHVGNQLLNKRPRGWRKSLTKLKEINWAKSNTKTWEGRAMIGGRISKASQNVTLTANFIKKQLNLPLSPEEKQAEKAFRLGAHEKAA